MATERQKSRCSAGAAVDTEPPSRNVEISLCVGFLSHPLLLSTSLDEILGTKRQVAVNAGQTGPRKGFRARRRIGDEQSKGEERVT